MQCFAPLVPRLLAFGLLVELFLPAAAPARAAGAPAPRPRSGTPAATVPPTPAVPAPAATPQRGRTSAGLLEGDPGDLQTRPDATAPTGRLRGVVPAATSQSTDGLVLERRADGSGHVNLKGRFRSYSVLILAPDGTSAFTCAGDPTAALAIARGAASGLEPAHARRPVFGPPEE